MLGKENILIIKLGAMGDVVRTLPLAKAIKSKYPNCELTWITRENVADIVEGCPYVDKVFLPKSLIPSNFDIIYNFDIESEATNLAKSLEAEEKYGFTSEGKFPSTFNLGAEYYLNLVFDDHLKKTNKKTYQEMMFMVAELPYNREHVMLELGDSDSYSNDFISENKIPLENLIGIHIGTSPRWPSKAWHKENIIEFVRIANKNNFNIMLFGGESETNLLNEIKEKLSEEGISFYTNNPSNTLKEFASLVNKCTYFVCCDSLSLHISLSLKKPTVALFFVTSPHEVETYDILEKIYPESLYEYFPEKSDEYHEDLVKSISAEEVLSAIQNLHKA